MITLSVYGTECTIEGGTWSGPVPAVVGALNAQEKMFRLEFPRGPSDPDPDLTSANHAAEFFGGRVSTAAHRRPRHVPGRVY